MGRRLDNRAGHWLLLAVAWAVLCLPALGRPSLWDIDEGNNADASREMFESGDWIVPTFNYQTRYDKPVLLYWLQAGAYAACGINEFAARLPSALAALLAVLVTYEIGRSLFGRGAGLLSGLVLASSVAFCASAHFANPDALLNLFTAVSLLAFWQDYCGRGRAWSAVAGAAAGLAVLAKGPVGLVLPVVVCLLLLAWHRRLDYLWDRRTVLVILAFCVVALPWYLWVAAETKGQWVYEFLMQHNYRRATQALENHNGPPWYYVVALVGGLAPWSAFLGPTVWLAWRNLRRGTDGDGTACQFLTCWFGVYIIFFSVVRTKLPNYILPAYPAAAVLTGCLLDRWRRGELALPDRIMRISLVCLALMGLGVGVGLLVAGGVIRVGALHGRWLSGLGVCAVIGLAWAIAAAAADWCLRRGRRGGLITCVALGGAAFTAGAASWGAVAVDRYKAVRALVAALPPDQTRRDVRIATFNYFQPSLVFYCRREVRQLTSEWQLADFLSVPLPRYVFLPAPVWEQLAPLCPTAWRLLGRHYDLYQGCDVVLIGNEGATYPGVALSGSTRGSRPAAAFLTGSPAARP
jgi:4-amino-4-deoxy-L-arabinose transferase-like glycosyltransferase